MKIFITGSTGFVGKHLVKKLLEEGHEVKALARSLDKAKDLKGAEIILGDLFGLEALNQGAKDADIIIHLAAMIHSINAKEEDYRKINVKGTENVIKACLNNKNLKRFIYSSSVTVYGEVKNARNIILTETHTCGKQNEYGKTKYEGEKLLKEYSKKYNLPYTIIRPGRVYGPGDFATLPLFKLIKKRLFIQVGGGKALMMPIYVSDLVDFIILCIEKPISKNKTYIAVGRDNIEKKKFMELVAKELNVKLRNLSVPASLAILAAFLIEMPFKILKKEPPVSRKQLRFFIESRRYSLEKAKKELGFKPKVTLDQGVKDTIQWFKQEGLL